MGRPPWCVELAFCFLPAAAGPWHLGQLAGQEQAQAHASDHAPADLPRPRHRFGAGGLCPPVALRCASTLPLPSLFPLFFLSFLSAFPPSSLPSLGNHYVIVSYLRHGRALSVSRRWGPTLF